MRLVTVGECFPYIKNGANIKQGRGKGGYPITRIETLSQSVFNRDRMGFADITDLTPYADRVLENGDILMSHINSIPYLGRSVMYESQPGESIIHGMNLLRLKADRSVIDPRYAVIYFNSPYFKAQLMTIVKKAVNQASYSIGDLKKLTIPCPSLAEQSEVIKRFQAINGSQHRLKQRDDAFDLLVKSQFVEMFGDGRFPLSPIASFAQSKMPAAKKVFSQDETIRYIDISSIDNETHEIIGTTEFIFSEAPSRAQQCIDAGDLLISTVRPNLRNVAINRFDAKNLVASSGFCVLRCMRCPVEYMKAIVCSDCFTEAMCKLTTGANYPAIKTSDVISYMIPDAPAALMDEYAAFVQQVDKSRFAVQQAIEQLELLRGKLMQEYFG